MKSHHIIPLLAAAGLAASTLAGPLTPPAGPVAPTMKTLTEVQPRTAISTANTPGNAAAMFVISQPGSYYLTGNITAAPGKACIFVTASQATIDLKGFYLAGNADGVVLGMDGAFTLRNGTIDTSAGSGVRCATDLAKATVEDVTCNWCAGSGFAMGLGATLRRCDARHCDLPGFVVGNGSVLTDCTASQNFAHGFQLGAFSTAADCTAEWNSDDGFLAGPSCTLSDCRATENTLSGFEATESTFQSCESIANGQIGFDIGSGSTVTRCAARRNQAQGLRAVNHNTITASLFFNHSAASYAGVWLSGSFNHVDRCESTANGYGFYLGGSTTQNVIVRSRASANSVANYLVPVGNQVAPIIANPGNTGFTTMTPWSNVAY